MLNIIKGLDRKCFTPSVCVSRLGGNLDDEVRELGIPLIEAPYFFPAKPYSTLLKRIREVACTFKPYQFDLWHSFHYGDDYTEPLVAYFSGAKGWIYTKKNMNWGTNAWFLRSLLSKRIVIINSEMKEAFFKSLLFRKKIRIIYRGIDLNRFYPVKPEDQINDYLYSSDNKVFAIGCLAHLVPVKGHPTLIESVSRLDDVHLFLAGKPLDKTYSNQLHAQVSNLGISQRVHFLGNVDDVSRFISQMDIVILPSRSEAFGVALIEAMASEKACIASDISGPREIIEDGVTGYLVPPEDPIVLANAIEILQNDPELRKKIGESARKRVVDQFSIDREVLAHEELYKELMGKIRKTKGVSCLDDR